MNSMSLQKKLAILIMALLFFCFGVGIIGFRSSQNIAKTYGVIESENLPMMTALLQGLAHLRQARITMLELTIPNLHEKEIQERRDKILKEIELYEGENKKFSSATLDPKEAELFKGVTDVFDKLKKNYDVALEIQKSANNKENSTMTELRNFVMGELADNALAFRVALDKLLEYEDQDAKDKAAEAIATKNSASVWIIVGIVGALLIGGGLSYFVFKNILADQEKTAQAMNAAVRNSNMVEKSPINTMMATPDGIFTYMNENSMKTLKQLQQYLPEKVENFMGKSIDMLHKNPEVARRIIKDPKNLPHKALISIGPEKLNLLIAAIHDGEGKYLGPMVTWEIVTDKVSLVSDLTKASDELATSASNVLSISSNLSSAAEETSAQANTASVASEEVNAGVQTVATNMEEMVAAIKEITKITNETASMTNNAMGLANNANKIINQLGESSMDIGNVIKVISSIAQQTNLLALNATIEAARAGDAGKGFAVVANEVKELANQTAKATHEITKKIEAIQGDSKNAVDAIADISSAIEKVNGFTANIAASMEEQAATTNEVTRVVTESAEGMRQISENITQVSQAAASTGKDAMNAQGAAKGVGEIADLLKQNVAKLKV